MIHSSKFSNDDLQKLRKVDKKYQTEFKKIFDKANNDKLESLLIQIYFDGFSRFLILKLQD